MININKIRNKTIKQIKNEIKEQKNNFKELQDTIIKLNEINKMEEEKENKNDKEEIEIIENNFNCYKTELNKYKINLTTKKYNLTKEEIRQIEKWTNKKLGEIIFDSEKDDWNINTSTFDTKLFGKSQFIIVIEDEKGNKFGGYSHEPINMTNERVKDEKLFLFSLKSNGRYSGMTKIESRYNTCGFGIWSIENKLLTEMGHGPAIRIYKENYKSNSGCQQSDYIFNYKGVKNGLCGGFYDKSFTPKRFLVIQMN